MISNVTSWPVMKDIEKKFKEEAPGVITAVLSKVGPGKITFQVRTTSDSQSLADWLTGADFMGVSLSSESVLETEINVSGK